MDTLRFAIIGCGQIAQRHAKHINAFGKLVSVCDVVAEKAEALAHDFNAVPFFSIEDFLQSTEAIDVVVVCTPNGLHAEHTIRCLHAGYHVLVEKPMALSAEDCDIMMRAATLAGKQIFTVMQNRFNKPVLAIKNAIDQNAFGKISSIQLNCLWNRPASYYANSWHGTKDMDGGILFTQFSHFIDLLYWFFGEVVQVHAITANADHEDSIEFEDSGVVALKFKNGIIGAIHFSVNSFAKNYEGSLTILGEKGTAKIGGEYLNTIDHAQFENYVLEITGDETDANDYGSYKGSMSNHDKVYKNLVDAIQNGKPFYVSPYEGMKTVELIEKIYQRQALHQNKYKDMSFQSSSGTIRNVVFGNDVRIVEPCNLYECTIGNHCFIGPFVEIQKGVMIGDHCKIQSHSFICELVTIGDHCFIGHGVMFVNDTFKEGKPAGDKNLWKATKIGDHVSIGSNATLLPVSICANVVVGAGAVVTKDITEPGTYAGNPARKIRS
jgi:UDP-N-acetyl-2-amino-2-deoxyglucuronate dehydrogenase